MANPHEGHRKRLRNEFISDGFGKWDDIKVLEYMLTYVIPRSDTMPMAQSLLEKYGSLRSVLGADEASLKSVRGMGEKSALFLKALDAFCNYCNHTNSGTTYYLTPERMEAYFLNLFKGRKRECLYAVYLDVNYKILHKDLMYEGSFETTEIDLNRILRNVSLFEAAGVVLAHNHPSGSVKPSGVDFTATQIVRSTLRLVGVKLCEHFIVTETQCKGFIRLIEDDETEKNIQKYTHKA